MSRYRLNELEKLMKEGFDAKANALKEEIKELKLQQLKLREESDGGIFNMFGQIVDKVIGLFKPKPKT